MKTRRDRSVLRFLWAAYAVLGLAGLGVLADTLFRVPPEPALRLPPLPALGQLQALDLSSGPLAGRRMTRRIASAPGPAAKAPATPAGLPLDSLIKLTGLLDFGGKQPALAVIETPSTGESKAYKAGDRVGETGVVVKDVKDYLVVEFEGRRYRVSFLKVEELPAAAVGAVEK